MTGRIAALTRYFIVQTMRSVVGVVYLALTLAYVYLFFLQQRTPDAAYYVIIIAAFGAAASFLLTLTIAGRAYRADHASWIGRLPSRVEYVTAVLLSGVALATLLQLLVAAVALLGEPELTLQRVIEIPPVWLSLNILLSVLALHATDLVARSWSRVYIYGGLLTLLFINSSADGLTRWLSARIRSFSVSVMSSGSTDLGQALSDSAAWLSESGNGFIARTVGVIFWPFRAILDANMNGQFSSAQALAPAFLLLYATILFLIAADLFANKDLFLTE